MCICTRRWYEETVDPHPLPHPCLCRSRIYVSNLIHMLTIENMKGVTSPEGTILLKWVFGSGLISHVCLIRL